jgi:poly-gamma-glutamate capsule biosynthesis protein CapA/YwtB (metallophosphatase superfamily)
MVGYVLRPGVDGNGVRRVMNLMDIIMHRLFAFCLGSLLCMLPLTGSAEELKDQWLTIAAVGDIMMGTTYPEPLLPPQDGKGIFQAVKGSLQGADLLFGNLEGPLLDEGESTKCKKPGKTCYAFKTPVRYVAYLKDAGFSALNIANNHASDFGGNGLESTISILSAAEIQAVGGKAIARFTIKGRRVAVVGFFYFETLYAYSLQDTAEAVKIVRSLKEANDLVVVSFHGGAEGSTAQHVTGLNEEFLGEDRGNVAAFAHAVIDAGADLVIGHGPHVLRALEVYQGKLIAYSLGNFLAYERFNLDGPNGLSVVLKVHIDPVTGDFKEGELVPVKLGTQGIPVPDSSGKAISLIRNLTKQDIKESGLTVADDGMIRLRQGRPRAATPASSATSSAGAGSL